ncbi:CKLF-like MARVEL transmembrane domain-containing protein 4 isoform X3 [Penaeus vannamei]|uniref:CKLF-like MARVEL transmembrane domain-containing protein 4 isoform X3 n=1 Tax=Penaeus vannamei TaxID=6689 RepID=UPI00387F3FDB
MMAETHPKSEVSSTVTTSPTYAAPQKASGISLCLEYFKTAPGIIKIIELVIGIFCMACAAPAWTNGTHWFLFVVVTAFVSTALWCFIYLLNLKSAINLPIDWLLTELILTALFAVLYIIASIVQLISSVTKPRPPSRLKPFYILSGELLNTAITTLLYLIAVIVQFCSIQQFPGRNIAGGIFGIFNLIAYAIGSFYLYRDWKDSHPHSSFSGSVLKRNP